MNFKSRFLPISLLPTLALTLVLNLNAHAATYVVNDTGNDVSREGCIAATTCTLPGAANAAINDDEDSAIVFDARVFADKQTITLAGNGLFVPDGQRLSITGPAAGVTVFADFKSNVLYIQKGGKATLTGLTISGSTEKFGAAIFNLGALTLNEVTVSGNAGGGILNGGMLTINDSTIVGNSAKTLGGGISNLGALTVNNSIISNNSTGQGGGLDNGDEGTVTVTNSTISDNSATVSGGGVFNSGTMTVTNSTLANNSTGGSGGAIRNLGALTVINSTLANNSAEKGGGIYADAGDLTVNNSTIANNLATERGGGIHNDDARSMTLNNSIVASNSSKKGANIQGDVDYDTMTIINSITDGSAADAGLDPAGLKDNGGPTQTIALIRRGTAVNAGGKAGGLSADQRGAGFARVKGGKMDIGAFESDFDAK